MERRENRNVRAGVAVLDVMVAASLVVALVAISTPMVIRVSQIWRQTRHMHLASDVLSAEMDRLLVMSPAERKDAMEDLRVPTDFTSVLPDARLSGRISETASMETIELSLQWNRIGNPPPMELTGWTSAVSQEAGE